MRKQARTTGVWGHGLPEKIFRIRCSEIASEAIFFSNLYLDSMPLEYRARVFLERRSGIAEPSLHVFQRRGMIKNVTVADSLKGGH